MMYQILCGHVNYALGKTRMQVKNTGHCNRAAVSRNRYGVEQTVDTHKILINEIQFYVCLQEI